MVVHRNIQLSAFSSIPFIGFLNQQLLSSSNLSIYCVVSRLGFGRKEIYTRLRCCYVFCSIPTCCVRCDATPLGSRLPLASLYLFFRLGEDAADCAIRMVSV